MNNPWLHRGAVLLALCTLLLVATGDAVTSNDQRPMYSFGQIHFWTAAAAGILYGIAYPVLDPYMGILVGWKAFVAAILGGRGSVIGAALAGFLLGFIEIFVATFLPSTVRDLVAYSIILIILTFRPHGFFGEPYTAQLRL